MAAEDENELTLQVRSFLTSKIPSSEQGGHKNLA